MIANINDRPVEGAMCLNCKTELRSMVLDTNKGKQTFYVCENENCVRGVRYMLTTAYFPPAEEGTPKKKS